MNTAEDRAAYIDYLEREIERVRKQMIRDGLIQKPDTGTKFFFWTLAMGAVLGIIAVLAYQGVGQ
jgi:hypothetical protein